MARFHHAFRWPGSDVIDRGASAATGEEEADRFRWPGGQSQ
jgi:hypothetical protein